MCPVGGSTAVDHRVVGREAELARVASFLSGTGPARGVVLVGELDSACNFAATATWTHAKVDSVQLTVHVDEGADGGGHIGGRPRRCAHLRRDSGLLPQRRLDRRADEHVDRRGLWVLPVGRAEDAPISTTRRRPPGAAYSRGASPTVLGDFAPIGLQNDGGPARAGPPWRTSAQPDVNRLRR